MTKTKPIITRKTLHDSNLDAFAKEIEIIWGQKDIKRPVLFQWLSVTQHVGAVAEEVRKTAWHNVVHELAEVFVWWLSFISSISRKPKEENDPDLVFYFNISPSDIVWLKFPNVCPLCFGYQLANEMGIDKNLEDTKLYHEDVDLTVLNKVYDLLQEQQSCQCMTRKDFVENRSKAFKKFVKRNIYRIAKHRHSDKPSNLFELQKTIKRIFKPNISALTLHEITFHLLEEVGEVAEALSLLHQQPHIKKSDVSNFVDERTIRLLNVCEELADVFAWIISLLEKSNLMLKSTVDFADKFWNDKPTATFLENLLQPTSNIVDLVWHIYATANTKKHMVCEVCGKSPCNAKHREHSENCGMLFGKKATAFYDEITSISLFQH